jgi:hypothetical protein
VLAEAEPRAAASGSALAVGWGRVPAGLREAAKGLGSGEATAAATALAPEKTLGSAQDSQAAK